MTNLSRNAITQSNPDHWEADVRRFQTSAPVNIVKIAESFGIRVWEKALPSTVSGMIKRDIAHGGPSQYSIIVNASEAQVRRRFTVAHELAHYLLHRQFIGDGLTDDPLYRSGLSTLQEVQANKTAADLLMPFALIEQEMSLGVNSISALARKFNVSEQAISIRLGVPS